MLISKTAFGESVYRSVVLDGYCHLDLFSEAFEQS